MLDDVTLAWRDPIPDSEMCDLVLSHRGRPEPGWWDRVSPHSLGWVSARDETGLLVSFVNVAWDGGDHAFLIDTKTRSTHQHRGLGTAVVREAVNRSRAAGCEWLHVDFRDELADFYFGSCGFRPTAAGLVHISEL